MRQRAQLLVYVCTCLWIGCASPGQSRSEIVGPAAPEPGAIWEVGDAVINTCGSLECHGTKLRSLRVFGFGSLRLDVSNQPGGSGTTDAEYTETYRGLIGLEPELTTLVTREKSGFTRLTIVRKARGLDNHKGGAPMKSGSPFEDCFLGWLASSPDPNACRAASLAPLQ